MNDTQGYIDTQMANLGQPRHGTYETTYDLIELLNEGGNAKVYRCRKKDTGEEYAIKVLDSKKQGEKLSRFVNEIAVMQKYGGAENGVLPIIDADAENGWYVMPIATPIEAYFEETKVGIKEKVAAIVEFAKALEALHEQGITHRDIKPDNLFRYKDRYCFGDFGLCEYPEGEQVYTPNDRQFGAYNTMAPEMSKNPQGQDGKKADVYSLAKTMWILLTGDKKGFPGPYSSEDSMNAFSHFAHLVSKPLAVIEIVLQFATDNNVIKRMSLSKFRKALETWTEHADDIRYLQYYEWYLLMGHIATETPIGLRYIFDYEQILSVLGMIVGHHKILNHVMIPSSGGLDLEAVEKANEEGCIYLHMRLETILVRPKALAIATYDKPEWNYILLETEKQQPILGGGDKYGEVVVEDRPAHYVSADYAQYGVYDYDSGEKLPEGYKVLCRQLKGSFMIVPKKGGYNNINATYDGRHDKMTSIELYRYVEGLMNGKEAERVFDETELPVTEERRTAPSTFAQQCVEEAKVAIEPMELAEENRISFAFYVEVQRSYSPFDFFSGKKWYLTKDGMFRNLAASDESVYRVYSREKAKDMREVIRGQFEEYYNNNGYDMGDLDCAVGVTLSREGKIEPRRFTIESIKELMKAADDRKDNKLVIDEYGRAKLVQSIREADYYPVTQGMWCAGNNYVGKYSSLSDAEPSYQYMLSGWLDYIKHSTWINVVNAPESVEELEQEIEAESETEEKQ